MMTRFRQRITLEMLSWVNDQIIGRKVEQDKYDDDDSSETDSQADESKSNESAEEQNEGTIILDATCASQNIRFPTDASLLNEAREKPKILLPTSMKWGLPKEKIESLS